MPCLSRPSESTFDATFAASLKTACKWSGRVFPALVSLLVGSERIHTQHCIQYILKFHKVALLRMAKTKRDTVLVHKLDVWVKKRGFDLPE